MDKHTGMGNQEIALPACRRAARCTNPPRAAGATGGGAPPFCAPGPSARAALLGAPGNRAPAGSALGASGFFLGAGGGFAQRRSLAGARGTSEGNPKHTLGPRNSSARRGSTSSPPDVSIPSSSSSDAPGLCDIASSKETQGEQSIWLASEPERASSSGLSPFSVRTVASDRTEGEEPGASSPSLLDSARGAHTDSGGLTSGSSSLSSRMESEQTDGEGLTSRSSPP
ncbi:uncharacterized protein LOC143473558 [Brachyhypopomus gauderio]|uniref:uncharacterized protein LOC143473558 n=1 Tax=Brachyhypopomus gauderio TaxID=698409 RepID=UPI004043450B